MPNALDVARVRYAFGAKEVLREISFSIPSGDILCILGPSGCGKTTLLKLIAGIYRPASGLIKINGEDQTRIPTHRRPLGFVFQTDLALFPHLDVFDNVAFPFVRGGRQLKQNERLVDWKSAVTHILKTTGLERFGNRSVATLSGGQAQRVALARAIVYRPSLLLLDEPLSKLDKPLKSQLVDLLLKLHREYPTTFVYVTHDDREVLSIATHVAILYDGELRQFGLTSDVVSKPATRRVAEILGGWNILRGTTVPGTPQTIQLDAGIAFECSVPMQAEGAIEISIPIIATRLATAASSVNGDISVPVQIVRRIPHQGGWLYECSPKVGDHSQSLLSCHAEHALQLDVGTNTQLVFSKEKLHELKS
jgi:ABC-type Fe3+/spermidine/putrescine transport system ATPase subunit